MTNQESTMMVKTVRNQLTWLTWLVIFLSFVVLCNMGSIIYVFMKVDVSRQQIHYVEEETSRHIKQDEMGVQP